jgi:hypothetical protein
LLPGEVFYVSDLVAGRRAKKKKKKKKKKKNCETSLCSDNVAG